MITWQIDSSQQPAEVRLEGAFTERSDFAPLLAALPQTAAVDLSGIHSINSTGVRAWSQFVAKAEAADKRLRLRRCSVMFMSQVNMIAQFVGRYGIESFMARFVCGGCEHWQDVLVDAVPASRVILEGKRPCARCGEAMEFDDILEPYLAVLQPPPPR